MLKKIQKTVGFTFISISVVFNIVLFYVLPSMIVVQWERVGSIEMSLAKPLALFVMMLVSSLTGISIIRGKTKQEMIQWMIFGLILLAINAFIAIVNLA